MPKRYLPISSVQVAFGLFISLFGLSVLLIFGENGIVVGCLLTLFFFELWRWLRSDRRITPNILFVVGWYGPAIISLITVRDVAYLKAPLQPEAFIGILLVSLIFYLISWVLLLTVKPRSSYKRESLLRTSQCPLFIIVALFIASNVGFVVSALNVQFRFPLFQAAVTQASITYFSIRGTGTLFSMGLVASLLLLFRLVRSDLVSGIRRPKSLELCTYALFLLYVIELILGGKRMGILMLIVSSVVVVGRAHGFRKRYLAYAAILVILVIAGNGYARGKYGFNQYWSGRSFNTVQSIGKYVMIQPVLYTRYAFGNLGMFIKDSGITGHGTLYTFAVSDGADLKVNKDAFSNQAMQAHMTTAFGAPAFDFGVLGVVLWSVVIFTLVWLLYFNAKSVGMSVFYAIVCANFSLLWIGNFLSMPSLYYYLFILLVINVIVGKRLWQSSVRRQIGFQDHSRETKLSIPADQM